MKLCVKLLIFTFFASEMSLSSEKIDIFVDLNLGNKNFTAYTMDLTKKYIEINADYRT